MINTYKIKNYILTGLLFLVFLCFGRSAEAATVITDGFLHKRGLHCCRRNTADLSYGKVHGNYDD